MERREFLKKVGAAGLAMPLLSVAGLVRPPSTLAHTRQDVVSAAFTGPKSILHCDDGGYYYCTNDIVEGGSKYVVWFGGSIEGTWGNIFVGRPVWNGQILDYISGKYWDVPYGVTMGNGKLEVTESRGNFYRRSEEDGFGGKTWTKVDRENHRHLPATIPTELRRGEGLTGIWITDTKAIYYIRQLGSDVVWFAARPDHGPANVFWGNRDGLSVWGQYMDVPWGQTEVTGFLSLEVLEGDDVMVQKRPVNGGYASTRFIRLS